jgi:F-type H+-transporting ATPase subunit b
MEQLGINLGLLIVQVLAFAIVFITLAAWVYKPFTELLAKRRETIAKGLDDAKVAAEERSGAEKEAQKVLSQAQQEGSRRIREAADSAEKAAQEMRAAAEKEIAALRLSAAADIRAQRDRMLAEVRPEVAALAIAATQKLIGETLDEKRQRALIDEFFGGVRSGKVILLEEAGPLPSAAEAEVVSALPLTESEQASIRAEVGRKAGAAIRITFQVDPGVLGGLKVRIGDRVIDGTVAGRIDNLRKTMS